jgi:hypothetical protein
MCLNKTYNKLHIGKHLSDNFPIRNGFVEVVVDDIQNTTALISDAQPLLAAQVLQLQLVTGYVLLLTN